MPTATQEISSYMIDTYKQASSGRYLAGAITFKGKKKADVIQWKERTFASQNEADAFVRQYFSRSGLTETTSESDLFRYGYASRW